MSKKFRDENTDMLMRAVASFKSIDECYEFFEDLCSPSEIKTMSQRFQVARMIKGNKLYSEIVSETGVATATISRVRNSLISGNGGYDRAIERMEN